MGTSYYWHKSFISNTLGGLQRYNKEIMYVYESFGNLDCYSLLPVLK